MSARTDMPRKIMIVAPHFAEYSIEYAAALSRHADVRVIVDRQSYQDDFDNLRVDRWPFPVIPRDFRSVSDFAFILGQIASFRPHIVHAQEASGRLKAALIATICGWPARSFDFFLTVHDPEPHTGKDTKIAKALGPLRAYVRAKAKKIFVHGSYCRDAYLRKERPADGTAVISTVHGVILKPTPLEMRQPQLGTFLMLGRMEEYKGLETLAGAAEILQSRGTTPKIIVAGRGESLDKNRSRLKALPFVEVHEHFLSRQEMIALLQRASCVVAPYLDATQSGIVAAAFGNGRPVIATRVGGLPDVIVDGRNGLLIPARDPVALADAMERLARNPALMAELQSEAQHSATSIMSWETIVNALTEQF